MSVMRAAVCDRYGPPEVLRIAEVARPEPQAGEVQVRVRASTVCAADPRFRRGDPWFIRPFLGLTRPRQPIFGLEVAGTVSALGEGAGRFAIGDAVFGSTGIKFGAHAEYACAPETGLEPRPANMTHEEAAAVAFGGGCSLFYLRRADIKPGMKVLVYGASGSLGVFAVQLARHFGAEVTAVCSTANLELVRGLGADHVVDYTREDYTAAGPIYDVVFDTVGKGGVAGGLHVLKRGGIYLAASAPLWLALLAPWITRAGRARFAPIMVQPGADDLKLLKDLIEAGAIRTVIERRYTLDDISAAHRHAETGRKKGHVVVVI